MKIVATTNGGVMLEATHQEVARLMGYESQYVNAKVLKKMRNGMTVNIDETWKPISAYCRRPEIAKKLRDAADNTAFFVTAIMKRHAESLATIAKAAAESLPDLEAMLKSAANDIEMNPEQYTEAAPEPESEGSVAS